MEDFWDALCSELEILKDKEKQDWVREYGNRVRKELMNEVMECVPGESEMLKTIFGNTDKREIGWNKCRQRLLDNLSKLK